MAETFAVGGIDGTLPANKEVEVLRVFEPRLPGIKNDENEPNDSSDILVRRHAMENENTPAGGKPFVSSN